jgi:hypothetical protein
VIAALLISLAANLLMANILFNAAKDFRSLGKLCERMISLEERRRMKESETP